MLTKGYGVLSKEAAGWKIFSIFKSKKNS